jgi:hypothetical protein
MFEERSATATRRWLWPKSIPTRGARRRVEREQDRRPAALVAVRGARLGALDDQAVGLQLGDQAGDGAAREAGTARDLGAADCAVLSQRADERADG